MLFSIWLTFYTMICCFTEKHTQYNHSIGKWETQIESTCDCKMAAERRFTMMSPSRHRARFNTSCPIPIEQYSTDSLFSTDSLKK